MENENISNRLIRSIAEISCCTEDEVQNCSKLSDLDFDSLDYVELIMMVEEEFGIDIDLNSFDEKTFKSLESVNEMADFIREKISQR